MKKRFWKIEYSITLFVVFVIVLMFIPTKFISSKEVTYISLWNETINQVEYVFNAMNAHAESDIIKSLKKAKTDAERERLMMSLVKPYLRISEENSVPKKSYRQKYMNDSAVKPDDLYYFDKLYRTKDNKIIGFKDIKDEDIFHPVFLMLFDMNGLAGPNVWGKDIFGLNIFIDGKITPLGSNWDIDELKADCSPNGTGVSCSHYYRIGGEFNE